MKQPSNTFHINEIEEEKLADTFYKHGYLPLKLCPPPYLREALGNTTLYYACKEGSVEVDGVVWVGKPDTRRTPYPLEYFDGSFDEFLDSLETYKERLKAFLEEQLSLYEFERQG